MDEGEDGVLADVKKPKGKAKGKARAKVGAKGKVKSKVNAKAIVVRYPISSLSGM